MQHARHIAQTLLTRTGSLEPPIIPQLLAEYLNIPVVRRQLPESSRGYSSGRRIVVNLQDQPEYQNFTIARELGTLVRPLDIEVPHIDAWPDAFADELLLPSDWFSEQGDRSHWDLAHLKWVFETATWEAIARKTLWFHKCVITILRNDDILYRKGHGSLPDSLLPLESRVRKSLFSEGCSRTTDNGLLCRGWQIPVENQPDVHKAVLMTETV